MMIGKSCRKKQVQRYTYPVRRHWCVDGSLSAPSVRTKGALHENATADPACIGTISCL
jgi:hypothetical protein